MRIRPRRRGLVAALAGAVALALLTGCTPEQSVAIEVPAQVDAELPAATVEQLQASVTAAMTAAGASGAIIGVWAPWSGSWVEGLGTQGPGGEAVDTSMTFRAADVTRAMTCDLLYELVGQGRASLDDAVTDLVSGVPDLEGITLGQLCDSTSGIGAYAPQLQSTWLPNLDRVWNPRELAAYGLAQPRTGEPGAAYRDSDAGYLLLGLALERITGEDLHDLIAERVADPLDLTATELPPATAATPSVAGRPALEGHWSLQDANGAWNCTDPLDVTESSSSIGWSDSGVVTDIADLGRYGQALATGALVPEGSGRFDSPVPVAADQPTWYTTRGGAFQAGSLIGQYGSVPGYTTAVFADPTTGMSVAVVLNNSGANPSIGAWLAWELAAIASKAPAAAGQSLPEAGLPWTAQQFHDQIAANAICAAPIP